MGVLPRTRTQHDYRTCRVADCERFTCRVYKEGYAAGHAAGFASGYAEGHADGYSEGYAEGASDAGE